MLDLHARAAHWWAGHDQPIPALDHASRADDHRLLSGLLHRFAVPLVLTPVTIKNSDPVGHNTSLSPNGDVSSNNLIPGGSQLFAVSGRIWNPTSVEQPVPDIRAELKDKRGRRVYGWTIARPVARLGPGQQISFDGAAVDVPAASSNVSVSFAGTEGN